MPQYDPKANRPKLVPVADDPAPVDALLGPEPAADSAPEAVVDLRPKLAVVTAEVNASPPSVPADEPGNGMRTAILVAVTAATVLGVIMVVRRGRT